MALTYNSRVRDLDIKGTIYSWGTSTSIASLTADDIISYSIDAGSGGVGIELGGTEAATFTLEVKRSSVLPSLTLQNLTRGLDNATVQMFIGIRSDDTQEYTYSYFGYWIVANVSVPEQSTTITLNGYDALASQFTSEYSDISTVYSTTIGSLLTAVCAAAGVTLKTATFPNSAKRIYTMPDWKDGTTLRDIVGYCACCAGGFAHIDMQGKLEILAWNGNITIYDIDPDLYRTYSTTGGYPFRLNCLQVKFDEDDEEYTRYVIDSSTTDNATNTIQIEGNPLMTDEIAKSIRNSLYGMGDIFGGTLEWGGDPAVKITDKFRVRTLDNDQEYFTVTAMNLTYDGGLTAIYSAQTPTRSDTDAAAYATTGKVMANGRDIKATRISGLDSSVVSATTGHFENLTATTVVFDKLLSSIISATTLKAEAIDATSTETDILTAGLATIIEATVKKLDAGTITSDSLVANLADIYAAKIEQATIGSLSTDRLFSTLADFGILTAGNATFDAATVRHLVSSALNVTNSTSGDAFINNLRVKYAQIVSATIGDLCLKATDGNYYKIDVDSSGNVTATQTTVTEEEIAQGHTDAGDVILGTNITAESMNTANIFATYALINQIDAARIDVDQLYARQAFIDHLNTCDIRSNSYIQMMVGEAEDNASMWEVRITSDDNNMVLDSGETTTLRASVYYGSKNITDKIEYPFFSWTRKSGNNVTDAAFDAAHMATKTISIAAGDACYNATYTCTVYTDYYTATLGTGKIGFILLGYGG